MCFFNYREYNGPVIIASPAGGMDIEDVAHKTPELIKTLPVDIFEGVTDEMANNLAEFLLFKGDLKKKAADFSDRFGGDFDDYSNNYDIEDSFM